MSKQGKVPAKPGNFATGLNANAVLTFTANRITLGTIIWSYSDAPTNGRLTVFGGGWNVDVDITAGGPGFLPFQPGEYAVDNNDVVVTLYAGGAGIRGKLNVVGQGAT